MLSDLFFFFFPPLGEWCFSKHVAESAKVHKRKETTHASLNIIYVVVVCCVGERL